MSYLIDISDTVQHVAEAISAALKVIVEIIDNEHYRVGGTGSLKKKLGQRQKWGYVNQHVINTRQHFILTNPGYHQICEQCELKGNCYCKVGIFSPIDYEGKCIGIISLMGFDRKQQETLVKNAEQYMEFITHMADLLASKVSEQRTLKKLALTSRQLEVVVNSIHYGIVSVDKKGDITCFNKEAEKILGINSSEALGLNIKDISTKSPLLETLKTGREKVETPHVYKIGNKKKTLLCSVLPIVNRGEIIGAVETFRDFREAHLLAQRLTGNDYTYTFDDILGVSSQMKKVKERAKRVAEGMSTILIEGESGTGKELFARAIHAESPFRNGPFVAVNCSAIPESLLESELFGYESGAFTGARAGGKPGKFELADGGTFFLDEIGDMPLYLQAKLLRVLQDRIIERVGGTTSKPVNVRIVAASNRNLIKMVNNGEFREDLYYRLSVIPIYIPPLRERKEDIAVMLNYNLERYCNILNKEIKGFSPEVYRHLMDYSWPGNVRELENTVECAVSLAEGEWIRMENLPHRVRTFELTTGNTKTVTLKEKNIELERQLVGELLKKYGTSVQGKDEVARILGVSRATLYRKIKKLGLKT